MTIIERVARALAIHHAKKCGVDIDSAVEYSNNNWQSHEDYVRTVIKGMREPSDKMLEAGMKAFGDNLAMPAIYQAMIDAALKE